ncbi:diacylglycerol O-acyltransferase [Mycobacterium conspicuum]|jgi:WS/DGAT/MGAT family acyltransferase|uniref:diacylglycerol O-acyltransferase n=2 Tax=Mycobacterium conspicuum TaxID=44010 RepID=A0A7I7Y7L8_9MYCO|nr:diacylglycerol O-acyltransferase [Mycobacterium conspicuum]
MAPDAGYLKAQDPARRASLAIAAVAVVDGAVPDYDLLKTTLAERIQAIPRCRQVLLTHPFDGGEDWTDYPGFDLAHHVRRVALPQPGDDAELFQAITHALERPLDLDRPLWECWIIEGLRNKKWAILMKVHHRMADGVSAAHLLTRLCDDADGDMFANHVGVKPVSETPTRTWAETLLRASAGAFTRAAEAVIWPGAQLSRPVTTMRRYGTVRVPVAAVDAVCRKFGVTANDVALAAITEGFRTVLLHRGDEPRAGSLRTWETVGHRRSVMLPYLPVEHSDPVQRLRTVHARLKVGQTEPPKPLTYAPFMLCAKAVHTLLTRPPEARVVTLETNGSGPRHRLALMGRKVDGLLPIPPTAPQLSTGVAALSYGDEVVFGITAGYDDGAELEQLAAGIDRGVAQLVALSQDSVLLFTRDRRKASPPPLTISAQRRHPSAPTTRARR